MTIQGDQLRLAAKNPCRIASTANLGLSGLADIDGVTPVAGDRVLAKDQSTASQNGIYIAASGAWSRSDDMANVEDDQIEAGLSVYIQEGTAHGEDYWTLTTTGTITLGSTNLTFEQKIATGDVSGPGSSTDTALAKWNGTGGDTLANSTILIDGSGNLVPSVTDSNALGTSSLMWSDLFLAGAGVINFNNGNVTITHAGNTLTFAGGSSGGYNFDNPMFLTERAAALGDTAGKGQFWVRNDVPNTAMFTDDAGEDFNLGIRPMWREPVQAATLANVNLTPGSSPDAVDGVTMAVGDRILVKDQTAGAENGIYVVTVLGAGVDDATWVRANDFTDGTADGLGLGVTYFVGGGTQIAKSFLLITPAPITVGSTSLTFFSIFMTTDGLGSTDKAILTADGTGGYKVGKSGATLTDAGDMAGIVSLTMTEQGGDPTPAAGEATWWVHSTTPNIPRFTDDTSVSRVLAQAHGGVYYVGKHGVNTGENDGKSPDSPLLTISQAITDINANETPSTGNRFAIVVIGGGYYIEDFTIPAWVDVIGPEATVEGRITLGGGDCVLRLHRLKSDSTGSAALSASTDLTAWVYIDQIEQTQATGGHPAIDIGGSSSNPVIYLYAGAISAASNDSINMTSGNLYGRIEELSSSGTNAAIRMSNGGDADGRVRGLYIGRIVNVSTGKCISHMNTYSQELYVGTIDASTGTTYEVLNASGTLNLFVGDLIGSLGTVTGTANVTEAGGTPPGIGGSTGVTDNALLRADGTGGSTAQNSLVTVSDTTGDMIFPDSAKIIWGAGNSWIEGIGASGGTGDITLVAESEFRIQVNSVANKYIFRLDGLGIKEQTASPSPAGGWGSYWVRDDVPNVPMFTDDTAVDHNLLAWSPDKRPCRFATTNNFGLSGLATQDGVTPIAGDRVLVRRQTTASQNGIYLANASTWTRAPDFDNAADDHIEAGVKVYVQEGTTAGKFTYTLITTGTLTIGTTALVFESNGGAISLTTTSTSNATASKQALLDEDFYTTFTYMNNTNATADDPDGFHLDLDSATGQINFQDGGRWKITAMAVLLSNSTTGIANFSVEVDTTEVYTAQVAAHSTVDPVERSLSIILDIAVGSEARVYITSTDTDTFQIMPGTTINVERVR